MRNATRPSGVSIAKKVKQLFPEQYEIALKAVIKENKEFNRRYAKEANLRNKEKRAAHSRAYYAAHREIILANAKDFRKRTDYYNKQKMKGVRHENKIKQTEITDQR